MRSGNRQALIQKRYSYTTVSAWCTLSTSKWSFTLTEYLWHNDEIPYDSDAKCKRGFSYYSNSIEANDTDIDVGTDVESLLDYSNTSICFYCVCSVSGNAAGCIQRDPIFCQFYRDARDKNYARDQYTSLFQQDRPAYFRHLSYRMRRTMDMGVTDYVEMGMDLLGLRLVLLGLLLLSCYLCCFIMHILYLS